MPGVGFAQTFRRIHELFANATTEGLDPIRDVSVSGDATMLLLERVNQGVLKTGNPLGQWCIERMPEKLLFLQGNETTPQVIDTFNNVQMRPGLPGDAFFEAGNSVRKRGLNAGIMPA